MTSTEIYLWFFLGVFMAVIDHTLYFRKISGAMGERVRAYYREAADRLPGGVYTTVAIGSVLDIMLPPVALAAILYTWPRDRRWCQEERNRSNVLSDYLSPHA